MGYRTSLECAAAPPVRCSSLGAVGLTLMATKLFTWFLAAVAWHDAHAGLSTRPRRPTEDVLQRRGVRADGVAGLYEGSGGSDRHVDRPRRLPDAVG